MTIKLATFSLAATDKHGLLAAASSSHFLAVGALVPHIRTGVGIILTQSVANPKAVDASLDTLSATRDPQQALNTFLHDDADKSFRQVAILSACGKSTFFCGVNCVGAVEVRTGDGYIAIGNRLKQGTIACLTDHFEAFQGHKNDLLQSIISAFMQTESALDEPRGKLAAAIIAKQKAAGYSGSDTLVDLRIDAANQACYQLYQLFEVHKLYQPSYLCGSHSDIGELSQEQVDLVVQFTEQDEVERWGKAFEINNMAHLFDMEAGKINQRFFASVPHYLALTRR